MKTCTFFGHRDCPDVRGSLQKVIEELITRQGVERIYVGNQGQFDAYVRSALRQLEEKYPHIHYSVVLTYLPGEKREMEDGSDTVFPEGLESIHPKYAIDRRNRWMLERSQVVVCYVTHGWGGAAKYVETAQRQGKTVINLYCGKQTP